MHVSAGVTSKHQAGLAKEQVEWPGRDQRVCRLATGGTMRSKPMTGETVGSGGHPRDLFVCISVCVCVCICLPAAFTRWDLGTCRRPIWGGVVQRLSTAVTLSPLNVHHRDGSRAGLMLTAFKAPHVLSKLEDDFDTDCQTSNQSCFSSPGKCISVP